MKTNLKLANIRYGYATNSSSSHSIIIPYKALKNNPSRDNEYGWDEFVLSEAIDKCLYIKTLIHLGDKKSIDYVNKLFPKYPDAIINDTFHIDHQSCCTLPTPFLRSQTKSDLYNWMFENIIENPNVTIMGGNDNIGMDGINRLGEEFLGPVNCNKNMSQFKIDSSGFMSVFEMNKYSRYSNLTKIRTLDRNGKIPLYGDSPDLIDFCITNYCTKGCTFCYQDSTPQGKHAPLNDIKQLLRKFKNFGVFELAIGGGEPTDHPDFIEILKYAYDLGMMPNFSTQSFKWIDNPEILHAVNEYCGSTAFSTQDSQAAIKWLSLCKKHNIYNSTIHYILGAEPIENLKAFIEKIAFYENLTEEYFFATLILLKWKECGRAGKQPYSTDGWWKMITTDTDKQSHIQIGIDSFLVDDVKNNMLKVPPVLYNADDGHFSYYVNAVDNLCGVHSSVEKNKLNKFNKPNDIVKLWKNRYEKI